MSAQPATARAQWANKDEQYAFYRRRDHDHIEGLQDYVVARLAEVALARLCTQAKREGLDPATVEMPAMPPKARQTISALQGSHGGGAVPFEEFERDQLTLAGLLGFSGQESARRSRVRDWLKALDQWQYVVGRQLVTIIPGGEIAGYRDDGTPVWTKTRFIDHLLPNADAGVQRARVALDRAFAAWRDKGKQGRAPNVGAYMAAEADWVIAQLPELGTPAESGAKAASEKQPFNLSTYVNSRRERLEAESKRIADKLTAGDLIKPAEIEERIALLDVAHEKAVRALDDDWLSARKLLVNAQETIAMRAANLCDPAEAVADVDGILAARGDAGTQADAPPAFGSTTTCKETTPPHTPETAPQGKKNLTPLPHENKGNSMEEAAVEYARNRLPVFPLWPLLNGICTCPCDRRCVKAKKHVCGANCTSPGKHPCTPNGFKAATVSEATIRAWWQRWPEAGIGIPTGKASGWLVVDIDPRHGGDASLTALTEQHGPVGEALEQATGGGGAHLAFDYNALPAGVEIGNSAGKLGPGLDVRGEGGYIVAAPTLHVSGRRYGWRNAIAPPPMPAWMIERLLAKDPPRGNEDYAPCPQRTGVFGAVIPDGQRNNGLFKVACGIWGKGQARDQIDLHAQLLEVNARRCSPPLDDGEVAMMAAHVAHDYPRGTPITSVDADKGAAAYSAAREVFEL